MDTNRIECLVTLTLWMWAAFPMSCQVMRCASKPGLYILIAASSASLVTPTPLATRTISSPSSSVQIGGIDTPILVALIGLASAALVACIGFGVAFYQGRRNARLEKEKQEKQNQHEQEMHEAQFRHEQDMMRLQSEIDEQRKVWEREQQRKEMNAEATLAAMKRAQTIAERAQAY